MGLINKGSFAAFCLLVCWFAVACFADRPCAVRKTESDSIICVCNQTYCDDIIREEPAPGEFIGYVSSLAGSRFRKVKDHFKRAVSSISSLTLELYPDTLYQTVEGFGGAVTDAAGINWRSLPDELQKSLIESYFSDHGIQYSLLRVPIGGCDFSTHPYAYNELPENDAQLSNYTLAYEDYQYKIPMIKAIMETSSTPIHIVATTWSPPKWMKTNNKFSGYGSVKPEYFQTYADYHTKFLERYAEHGIPVWGITTTNEPINSGLNFVKFNDMGWSPEDMGKWIEENLGPTIRNSTYNDLKILTVDDQRYTIPYWFTMMVQSHPKVLQYIDGVAVHYYADQLAPPYFLSQISEQYPGKFVLATEASEGSYPWDKGVVLGPWRRARHYITDILQDLNYNVTGWMDWNLCLDKQGGPNWVSNFVDSPIIVFPEKQEFIKQPLFYAMGHFSKFIPRGSRRIQVTEDKQPFTFSADNVAFLTPYNTIVVVLFNDIDSERTVTLKVSHTGKKALFTMEPNSVITLEFLHEEKQ